jgi:enediyne biosynthesis protein E4
MTRVRRLVPVGAVLLLAVACSEPTDGSDTTPSSAPPSSATPTTTEPPVLTAVVTDRSPVTFEDVAASSGIAHQHQASLRVPPDCLFNGADPGSVACNNERMSGGVAVGDYDGDGVDDLYFTQVDGGGRLYRNGGDGTFEDVTAAAGLENDLHTNGAGFADLDRDGFQDLVVTTLAGDRFLLFMNQGDGTFVEEGTERGVALRSDRLRGGQSVAFGDIDNDGWIDIHLTEWIDGSLQSPAPSAHARLLRNRGEESPGRFEDVTEDAGVVLGTTRRDSVGTTDYGNVPNYSFGSALVDLDGDGWSDLLVAADYGTTQLFWNDGDGTFTEGTDQARIGTEGNAMGLAVGDVDGDGLLDVFITAIFGRSTDCAGRPCDSELTGNRLYLNNGDRTFREAQGGAGVTDGAWGWGAAMVDVDNDGLLDLAMVNGVDLVLDEETEQIYGAYGQTPSRLWLNQGDGTFADAAAAAGLVSTDPMIGLVVVDLDGDGALDLVAARNSGPPVLWRNSGTANRWLRVEVRGTQSNPDGVGAIVEVVREPGSQPLVRHVGAGTHFLGQSERTVQFGLGTDVARVAEVRVRWPATGRSVVRTDVPVDQTIEIEEPDR